jgi:hypothetical protein
VDLKEMEWKRVDFGKLRHYRNMWRDVVKTVMYFGVSQNVAIFLTSEELSAS